MSDSAIEGSLRLRDQKGRFQYNWLEMVRLAEFDGRVVFGHDMEKKADRNENGWGDGNWECHLDWLKKNGWEEVVVVTRVDLMGGGSGGSEGNIWVRGEAMAQLEKFGG